MPAPLTDAERQEIIDLLPSGKSCAAIARQVGRGTSTVSRLAREVGHDWGQSNLAHAHDARRSYSAERRAIVAARMLDEALVLLEEMHGPYLAFNFGGKDNTYEEELLDAPPVDAKRQLMASARDAMRTVLDIAKLDEKADQGQAKGLLEQLVESLGDR